MKLPVNFTPPKASTAWMSHWMRFSPPSVNFFTTLPVTVIVARAFVFSMSVRSAVQSFRRSEP